MGKKLQRRFPSHKRASISVLNQAVVQSPGDDFERTTHLNVCVLRCLFKYLRKKKPRGLQLLLTGSCWWSGESSGVINSKQRITENSGCLTSDVWYNIWKAYISYCVFAFLIMFCFSQYENELTSWEYKPVPSQPAGKLFGCVEQWRKSQGIWRFLQTTGPACNPPGYNGVLAAIRFISSSRIKPTLPPLSLSSLRFSPAPAR